MDISLQTEISEIRVIDENRNYWFIRTYGGKLYDYFRENNFIGLGFNNVPFNYIKDAKPIKEIIDGEQTSYVDFAPFNRLQKFISENSRYKKGEATKWANQLIDFEHEIKLGDLVVIPSENSDYLSFGVVESDVYIVDVQTTFKFNNKFEPYPEKRRKIKWLKEIPKDEFRGALNPMFFSRTAIRDANEYSDIIEGNLSSIYIRDEHIYLSIKIDQDEEINAFELQRFLEGLTYLYKELCIDHGIEDNEDLYIKIKVQSKGNMFLKGVGVAAILSIGAIIGLAHNSDVLHDLSQFVEKNYGVAGVIGIAGVLALSDNPTIKLEIKDLAKLEGKSGGFLKSITNFLDANHARKEIKAETEHKRKIELLKFTESIEQLKAKSVDNPVTKEQDSVKSRKKK